MAEEPDNIMLGLLREIRSSLGELQQRFDGFDRRLAHVEQQQEDLSLQVTYSLGLGTTSNLKAQTVANKSDEMGHLLDKVIARVEALEAR